MKTKKTRTYGEIRDVKIPDELWAWAGRYGNASGYIRVLLEQDKNKHEEQET